MDCMQMAPSRGMLTHDEWKVVVEMKCHSSHIFIYKYSNGCAFSNYRRHFVGFRRISIVGGLTISYAMIRAMWLSVFPMGEIQGDCIRRREELNIAVIIIKSQ